MNAVSESALATSILTFRVHVGRFFFVETIDFRRPLDILSSGAYSEDRRVIHQILLHFSANSTDSLWPRRSSRPRSGTVRRIVCTPSATPVSLVMLIIASAFYPVKTCSCLWQHAFTHFRRFL